MKTSTKPVRVLIADDHEILREGIVSVLSTMEAIDVVGEANNAEMAVVLFEQLRPDVTVLDLKMPLMGGIEAIKAIRRIDSAARILALTAYQGDVLAREVLAAGAAGYMLKHGIRKELVEAISNIANGFKHISLDVALELGHYCDSELLSQRELEVLRYVAVGNTNRKIGELMGLSEETIKTHVKTILAKTKAHDRTHAVTIALQRGMLRV
ncbi:response regulator transcription factor [Duganella dendranthematis]|uniref:Response regulator transcription factor n=1 Tax=Duganella dendranthematis TaxID=2728021 RepID=A0ABX6M5P3_9BURK|nr:response regulator transcription factor [Duganella dendranthematis]QJD89619.1 response regulator transcription factor [Duganella dendranthematis]